MPDATGATPTPEAAPLHTGSRATRALGLAALAATVLWALYGLVWSPPDVEMGDLVRLLYVHVPVAVLMYTGAGLTTFASVMWLRGRTPGWDSLAVASAELGVVFGALTLLTGSIWGKPTWNTWWTWDARLTSTALLEVLLIGYLAVRKVDPSPAGGSVRASVLGLLLFPNVIIVHYSVDWWRSLHQPATVTRLDPTIEGDMLVALMVGLLAGGLTFGWLLLHRFRVAWLEQQVERHDLAAAVADRRAEGDGGTGTASPTPATPTEPEAQPA
ncbi:MAG TPA: cytochrome c biogenesis protein CcsA [Acidimicrobiales bacterium]